MRQRTVFIKLRNYCVAQNLTITQVENATVDQVIGLLNLTDAKEIKDLKMYFSGMQRIIISKLQDQLDELTMLALVDKAKTWLEANFPAFSASKDFSDSNNRTVTIHLDGGPS